MSLTYLLSDWSSWKASSQWVPQQNRLSQNRQTVERSEIAMRLERAPHPEESILNRMKKNYFRHVKCMAA